jgi:hypothetical protein
MALLDQRPRYVNGLALGLSPFNLCAFIAEVDWTIDILHTIDLICSD